jgi:predicted nucleic acid-binding protein
MMNADCVIVDANIAFKCLCAGRGDLRGRVGPGGHPHFFSPRFLFIELFKHKERLMHASGLAERDLLEGLYAVVSQLQFVGEANIPIGTWVEAYRLCKGVDTDDTPYVALTLHLDGRLWTEDGKLKETLRARGFDRFFEP